MKKIQLFIILLSMGVSTQSAIAQRHGDRYKPTVYMVAIEETDTLYDCPMQAAAARQSMAAQMALL